MCVWISISCINLFLLCFFSLFFSLLPPPHQIKGKLNPLKSKQNFLTIQNYFYLSQLGADRYEYGDTYDKVQFNSKKKSHTFDLEGKKEKKNNNNNKGKARQEKWKDAGGGPSSMNGGLCRNQKGKMGQKKEGEGDKMTDFWSRALWSKSAAVCGLIPSW